MLDHKFWQGLRCCNTNSFSSGVHEAFVVMSFSSFAFTPFVQLSGKICSDIASSSAICAPHHFRNGSKTAAEH